LLNAPGAPPPGAAARLAPLARRSSGLFARGRRRGEYARAPKQNRS